MSDNAEAFIAGLIAKPLNVSSGGEDAIRLVRDFGGKCILEWDSPMGLKAYNYEGKEVMELRIDPSSDQLILKSGKSRVQFVRENLIIKHDNMGIEIVEGTQFYIYDKNNHPMLWLNPERGSMRFSNAQCPSGFEVNVYDSVIRMNGQTVYKASDAAQYVSREEFEALRAELEALKSSIS